MSEGPRHTVNITENRSFVLLWNPIKANALVLGMKHLGSRPYQVSTNDESSLTVTYFTARSNLIPSVIIYMEKNLEMII